MRLLSFLGIVALGCSPAPVEETTIYYQTHPEHISYTDESQTHEHTHITALGGQGGAMNAPRKTEESGWSTAGTITTRTGLPGGFNLQAKFPELDNYTVQFNVETLDGSEVSPGVRRISRPQALIEWTAKGNTARRIVDVFEGTSLTGQAESLVVRMYDGTIISPDSNDLVQAAPGIQYAGSIQVTKGRRVGSLTPARQGVDMIDALGNRAIYYAGIPIGPGDRFEIPIPNGTGAQAFLFTYTLLGTVTSDFEVSAEDVSGLLGNLYNVADDSGKWLPIPAGAQRIQVRNQAGAGFVQATVWFGVDG